MTKDEDGFTTVRKDGSVDELHAAKVMEFAKVGRVCRVGQADSRLHIMQRRQERHELIRNAKCNRTALNRVHHWRPPSPRGHLPGPLLGAAGHAARGLPGAAAHHRPARQAAHRPAQRASGQRHCGIQDAAIL